GPWSGVLQNDDEQVELRKPRAPDTNGSVPYILVDRVHYHDSAPWPDGADGLGLTLQRKVHSSYGNDPTNWIAGAASPGAAYSPDTTPAITSQPGDTVAYSTSNVTFNVTGTGSNVRYQWRFMGENITGATNSS